jgi:hypothetical protein
LKTDIAALPSHRNLERIDGIRNQVQTRIAEVLADLRDGALSAAAARAAEREIITLSAIGDAIERGGMLLVGASEF